MEDKEKQHEFLFSVKYGETGAQKHLSSFVSITQD
jgi:hypothetical protein